MVNDSLPVKRKGDNSKTNSVNSIYLYNFVYIYIYIFFFSPQESVKLLGPVETHVR